MVTPTGLIRPIRLIRLIRDRIEDEPILRRSALQAETSWVIYTEGVAPGYSE